MEIIISVLIEFRKGIIGIFTAGNRLEKLEKSLPEKGVKLRCLECGSGKEIVSKEAIKRQEIPTGDEFSLDPDEQDGVQIIEEKTFKNTCGDCGYKWDISAYEMARVRNTVF